MLRKILIDWKFIKKKTHKIFRRNDLIRTGNIRIENVFQTNLKHNRICNSTESSDCCSSVTVFLSGHILDTVRTYILKFFPLIAFKKWKRRIEFLHLFICKYFKLNAKFKFIWLFDFLLITASKFQISFSLMHFLN